MLGFTLKSPKLDLFHLCWRVRGGRWARVTLADCQGILLSNTVASKRRAGLPRARSMMLLGGKHKLIS